MFSPFQKKKGSLEQQQSREDAALGGTWRSRRRSVQVNSDASQVNEEPAGSILLNKGHMDNRSLDLLFAVEQMIKAKQQLDMSHNDLQDRLSHANGQNDRLNRDFKNLGKVVEEREKSVLELEQRLADKNLKVDQMMEDYREIQSTLSGEIGELKSVIELERQNYAGLLHKHNETTADKNKKISELEEKNARLEAELTQTETEIRRRSSGEDASA